MCFMVRWKREVQVDDSAAEWWLVGWLVEGPPSIHPGIIIIMQSREWGGGSWWYLLLAAVVLLLPAVAASCHRCTKAVEEYEDIWLTDGSLFVCPTLFPPRCGSDLGGRLLIMFCWGQIVHRRNEWNKIKVQKLRRTPRVCWMAWWWTLRLQKKWR